MFIKLGYVICKYAKFGSTNLFFVYDACIWRGKCFSLFDLIVEHANPLIVLTILT